MLQREGGDCMPVAAKTQNVTPYICVISSQKYLMDLWVDFPLYYSSIIYHINTRYAENHSHYVDDDGASGGDQHYVAIDLVVVVYYPLDG